MDASTVFFLTIVPMFVSGWIAKERNRSVVKGAFVGFLLGWIGTAILALFLKVRDKETGFFK